MMNDSEERSIVTEKEAAVTPLQTYHLLPEVEVTEHEETECDDDGPLVGLKAVSPVTRRKNKLPTSPADEEKREKVLEAMMYLAAKSATGNKPAVVKARVATRPCARTTAAVASSHRGMTPLRLAVNVGTAVVTLLALMVTWFVSVKEMMTPAVLYITRAILCGVLAYVVADIGEAYLPEEFVNGSGTTHPKKAVITTTTGRRRTMPPLAKNMLVQTSRKNI